MRRKWGWVERDSMGWVLKNTGRSRWMSWGRIVAKVDKLKEKSRMPMYITINNESIDR